MVHSDRLGPVALGRDGEQHLASGRIVGSDPVAIYGPRAADGLRRLDGFSNTGDLIVIGPYDPATGEVVSYEDLVGSHGGLGGWQGEPFVLHPSDLPVGDEPLVGAPAVHAQLRVWLDALKNGVAHPDDRPAAAGEEAVPAPKPVPATDTVDGHEPPESPESPEPPGTPETPGRTRREPVGANATTPI